MYGWRSLSGVTSGRSRQLASHKLHPDELHDADGWLYRLELVDCGKGETGRCRKCANGPGHGPYWYRYKWQDGKMHKRYVGKALPLTAGGDRQQSKKVDTTEVAARRPT